MNQKQKEGEKMQTLKRLFTSWHMVLVIGAVLAILLFQNKWDLGSFLFLAILLLCPLMMIFMMDSHHHRK